MWRDFSRVLHSLAIILLLSVIQVSGELCKQYGHYCNAPSRCCGSKCCSDQDYDTSMISYYRWNLWNMWYFWFIIVFILMSCFGGCGYYKRRQMLFARQRSTGVTMAPPARTTHRSSRAPVSVALPIYPQAYAYAGPAADPTAFFMAPPPYSEVVSQPGMYPVNKADLPPYPGDNATPTLPQPTCNTANSAVVPMQRTQNSTVPSNLPPAPSYTETTSNSSGAQPGAAWGVVGVGDSPSALPTAPVVSPPSRTDEVY